MRWTPHRAGIINIWRYVDETFEFHNGRLLLRGPNGSGKSMALELLFPFLLDARAQRSRLSSASQSRGGLFDRMMSGGDASKRVGFLWAEFRRGEDHAFTAGVRLRASQSSQRVTSDWFTTTQRVGDELELLDSGRAPLSRERLRSALEDGGAGRLHGSADEYRSAVRERLFPGFGPEQYEALLAALLALRVEKVSQNLTPAKLGEILTASLPPLDDREIASLAEGFEKLDRRREDLEQLRHQFHHVRQLAKHVRRYGRNVLARESGSVRTAETRRDDVIRQDRQARNKLAEARLEVEELERKEAEARARQGELEATIEALRERDAFKEGIQIESLRQEANRARRRLEGATAKVERLSGELERAGDRTRETADAHRKAVDRCGRSRDELAGAVAELGAGFIVEQLDDEAPGGGDDQLRAWIETRIDEIAAVEASLREVERLEIERESRDRGVEDERELVDKQTARRDGAEVELERARVSFAESLARWAGRCRALDAGRLGAELGGDTDPDRARVVIESVAHSARNEVTERRVACERSIDELEVERGELNTERERLAAGALDLPAAPAGRRDRSDLAGAPLWALVDFRDAIDGATRDRIESALAAAGLLDAWVSADGCVDLSGDQADALLDAGECGVEGPRLADVLQSSAHDAVSPDVVSAILDRIELRDSALDGRGDERAVIGRDGTFRLALLAGAAPPEPARYIGAAARERERLRRLSSIEAAIAALDAELAMLGARLSELAQSARAIDSERALAPGGADVTEAVQLLSVRETQLEDAFERLRTAEKLRADAETKLGAARLELERFALSHRLPSRRDKLEELRGSLRGLAGDLRRWVKACGELAAAAAVCESASSSHARIERDFDEAGAELDELSAEVRELDARLVALDESVGAEYREIAERIDNARRERKRLGIRQKELNKTLRTRAETVGQLSETVESTARSLAVAIADRDRSHQRFAAAIRDGIADDAAITIPEGALETMTATLEAARKLAAELTEAGTDKAIARTRQSVQEAVHAGAQELGGRVDFSFEESSAGDWQLLRASSQGIRQTTTELIDSLAAELEAAEGELAQDEQKLFDETLTGSVRDHVTSRIRLATALVDRLNNELVGVKTDVAGVGVQLKWEVNPDNESPAALRSARELLLRDPAGLGESERGSLHDFLRSRIDLVRAGDDPLARWDAQLVEALDYRAWHRFRLVIGHRQWEGYKDATSSRWAKLSTGERSIALHLPMLASIVAHYGSTEAGSTCPRLIVLDELFAGVDPSNRAKLLGMLVRWDLDAVLTSDHEWCAYSSLDGIAIHHVHGEGQEAGDPVTTSRFVWNGEARMASPVAAATAP